MKLFRHATIGRTVLAAALLMSIHVPSIGAPELRHIIRSPAEVANGKFGHSVCAIDDINGDGKQDVVIAATGEGSPAGRIYLYDPVTGTLIRTISSSGTAGSYLGLNVGALSDISTDGIEEIGAWLNGPINELHIIDPTTGIVIRPVADPEPNSFFGCYSTSLGDLTGDSVAEYAVAMPLATDSSSNGIAGKIAVYNGATGVEVYQVESPISSSNSQFGIGVLATPDFTGDGVKDFVARSIKTGEPRVFQFSGADGSHVRTFIPPDVAAPGENIASFETIAILENRRGPGTFDLAISFYVSSATLPHVYLIDPLSGALTGTILPSPLGPTVYSGLSLSTLPDISGDGIDELAMNGDPTTVGYPGSSNTGCVYVFDGSSLEILERVTSPATAIGGPMGMAFGTNPIVGLEDNDGNGFGELVVGCETCEFADGPADAGVVYVYSFDATSSAGEWTLDLE